jgi:hypothetical protein
MPLVVLGIFFLMGSMAFAQTAITCGLSVPLGATPNAIDTGHTEPIAAGPITQVAAVDVNPPTPGGGVLRVTCNNTGAAATAVDPGVVVLTVNLGVPITNNTSGHPSAAAQIRLALGPTPGVFNTGAPGADRPAVENVHIAALNNSAGQIVISLGSGGSTTTPGNTNGFAPTTGIAFTAGTVAAPAVNQFDILGVLVSTNGKTGAQTAFLTSTGGIGVGSTTAPVSTSTVTVISNVVRGLKDPTVPTSIPSTVSGTVTGGAAVLNSAGNVLKGNFAIRIEENSADTLRESSQFNGPGQTGNFPQSPAADSQVEVRLANIPNGLDISSCTAVLTDTANAVTAGSPQVNFTTFTSASPVMTINFNAPLSLTAIDVLWVLCATVNAGTATLPLPNVSVTATVNLGPTGIALSTGSGNPALTGLTTGQVPRYQLLSQPTAPITVVVFPPSNSTLLISFGAVLTGYDTGIAVANTTADPFGPTGGGAPASEGTVTFTMYKNDGTSKVYTTTTGSPGSGLTGAGVLKSGSTYTVNLSQLLTSASFGPSFLGYIFVNANFTNAHGSATVYLTSSGGAALSSPALVVGSITTATPRPSPEGLGQ